ncbi:putative outer membrane protein, partial [Salmonella enterica subsp. enterica serovar Enteritidis str. 607308-19]
MKQKEYRTVRITRHMRAGMLAAGLLLPLVA